MIDHLFTTAARRHVWRMLHALAPQSDQVERHCRAWLRGQPYDDRQIRAFLALLPAAATQFRSLPQFLEQVGYSGRRLARLNVPPSEVREVVHSLGNLLGEKMAGRFAPAREHWNWQPS